MKTIDLIHLAEQRGHNLAELSRKLGVTENMLSNAKHAGRLSPALAAGLADELGENVGAWTVAAAAEATKAAPLHGRLTRLLRGIHL